MTPDWRDPRRDLPWDSLSPAELRIVRLVCAGLTNPEIGQELYLSRRTVQSHLYSIFKKLKVRSRTELAARAVQAGIERED